MNFKNILINKTSSYLFTFLACGFIMLAISSCKEDIPGVGGIEDLTPPNAVFSYLASSDNYAEITFSNTSLSSTDYSWSFGDGGTSAEAEPVHTYAEDGSYTVSLTASDKNGVESTATETVVIAAPPVPLSADFSFAVSDVDFNSVTFTNLSVSADTYAWDFGDGDTSTDENPVHAYDLTSGSYEVSFTASSSLTAESETVTRTVNIVDPSATLVASYSYEADAVNTYEITFTNSSIGAISYLWDFGDGNTSTDANPVYTYASPGGTFTVTLTATDPSGASQTTSQTITVVPPVPTFTPVILEPGFEDNSLPDGTGDGRDSWKDAGEELGGVIQITESPVFAGTQAAKLPADGSRVGYQKITVEAGQNYIITFQYTIKTADPGSITVAVLDSDVDALANVAGSTIESVVVNDQTDQNAYVGASLQFNSGSNTEVWLYFKNEGSECRLDDFDIQNN